MWEARGGTRKSTAVEVIPSCRLLRFGGQRPNVAAAGQPSRWTASQTMSPFTYTADLSTLYHHPHPLPHRLQNTSRSIPTAENSPAGSSGIADYRGRFGAKQAPMDRVIALPRHWRVGWELVLEVDSATGRYCSRTRVYRRTCFESNVGLQ